MAKKLVAKKTRRPLAKRIVGKKPATKRRTGGGAKRSAAKRASAADDKPPPPTRNFQVTILDPVTDSEVGRSFTVCGSCDAAAGLRVLVRVWEGNNERYREFGTIDDFDGWQVEFTDVAQANNYRITAELENGGSNIDEVTEIDVAKFSIDDPSSDSPIGTECSVTGHCFDAIGTSLTVDVIFTPSSGPAIQEPATVSPEGYFVAHFPSLPTGSGGSLRARDGNNVLSDEVTGLTVEDSTSPTTITDPANNGQIYDEIDSPDRAGRTTIHRARGKHKNNRTVFAYVTLKGKCFRPPIRVTDDGAGGAGKRNWVIELYKLFRGKAPAGTYHFHLVAVNPSGNIHKNHHHRSSGRIVVLT
jgi:hypothetical protein